MIKSQKIYQIGLSFLVLFLNPWVHQISALAQPVSITQTPPSAAQPTPPSANWSDFPQVKQQFMKGCVGKKTLSTRQKGTKQQYCQCAFNAYKTRYTPQVFAVINAHAVKIENGPNFVNLMMKPEMDQCSAQTGFTPS